MKIPNAQVTIHIPCIWNSIIIGHLFMCALIGGHCGQFLMSTMLLLFLLLCLWPTFPLFTDRDTHRMPKNWIPLFRIESQFDQIIITSNEIYCALFQTSPHYFQMQMKNHWKLIQEKQLHIPLPQLLNERWQNYVLFSFTQRWWSNIIVPCS